MHMPGHKGVGPLGIEGLDITEICGADVLYQEDGILAESQKNATEIFGSRQTLYSTEGSTLAIRAMLTLAVKHAEKNNKKAVIAAGRAAHKSFLTTCALLDLSPIWIDFGNASLLSGKVTKEDLRPLFRDAECAPTAVYITSPDYLGNVSDIASLSRFCHENGAILLVDNAHGAYLNFYPSSCHPIALGADLCCDSAHKTLPVLTGGAYLHIGKDADEFFLSEAKSCLSLFASTSPSYLILQSLDACNAYLSADFPAALLSYSEKVQALRDEIRNMGFQTIGDEPLKICIVTKPAGYTGTDLARILRENGMECEFSDPDFLVMMFTPQNGTEVLHRIKTFFAFLEKREPILVFPPKCKKATPALSIRRAMLCATERIPIERAAGRILADPAVSCPPAVPIAICGEKLDDEAINAFSYYGIRDVLVVKEK